MEFRKVKKRKKKEKRERKVALCACIDVVFVCRIYNHNCCREEVQLVMYWCMRVKLYVWCVAFFTFIHFGFFTVALAFGCYHSINMQKHTHARNKGSRISDKWLLTHKQLSNGPLLVHRFINWILKYIFSGPKLPARKFAINRPDIWATEHREKFNISTWVNCPMRRSNRIRPNGNMWSKYCHHTSYRNQVWNLSTHQVGNRRRSIRRLYHILLLAPNFTRFPFICESRTAARDVIR